MICDSFTMTSSQQILNAEGEALVGDFGGASLLPAGATLSIPLQASAETVAPEIATSWNTPTATASFASDVYSLGATTFWLLAGTTPHDFSTASNLADRYRIAASQAPRSIRDVAPHVPQSVAAIVERSMRRDPNARYQTALDFAAAISSRILPSRKWKKTGVHPHHIGCWEGTAGTSVYQMCLEAGVRIGQGRIVTIQVGSGRRVLRGCRDTPLRNWPQVVRSVIRALN
jgi:serine/threonine protein kinase